MIIHLFHIPTLAANIPLASAQTLLSQEEASSAQKIKAERRLHEFIYGRYSLKNALSTHLNTPIKNLDLLKHPHGKLYLAGNPTFFNLTHSGDYLAFCICDEGEIGIDIEHLQRRTTDLIGIAERYFTQAEYLAIKNCDTHNQYALFYKIWTLKEAALKATGIGISAGLERINALEVKPEKSQILQLEHSRHKLWFNHWTNPLGFDDTFLAVALERTNEHHTAVPLFELTCGHE